MSEKLFPEFPAVSTEAWREAIIKDLKGADYDKKLVSRTLDGVIQKPFYRREDVPAECEGVVRGHRRSGNRWKHRATVREQDIAAANRQALNNLERGAHELSVLTFPMGVELVDLGSMRRFLHDLPLGSSPIHWLSGPLGPKVLAMFLEVANERGFDTKTLKGSVENDPLMDRCAGWTQSPFDSWRVDLVDFVREIATNLPAYNLVTIRASFIEKAGASLCQELAFSIAILTEYLTTLQEALIDGRLVIPGQDTVPGALANIVSRLEIRYAVGCNYFLEISKLRTARLLIANVLQAFGVGDAWPKVHVVTTSSNKTLYDPYDNLLRATIESMAAVIAGVDSLQVAAYDEGYGAPDEFGRHLARNTEALLKSEAHLGMVADPLGGSYTVEALTREIANLAWASFISIEARGGFAAAWQAGEIEQELRLVQGARHKMVDTRKRSIVGTTVYPNLKERRLPDVVPHPKARQAKPWPAEWTLQTMLDSGPVPTLGSDKPVSSTALDRFRPSWPYENLRLRVERHIALAGKQPIVLLAGIGDAVMRRARSAFCLSLFGAAGYDVREQTFESAKDIGRAANEMEADLVVLCSSDAAYVGLVKDTKARAPIVIAGNPAETREELLALGVHDFVHLRQDIVETLTKYHQLFRIPEMPIDQPTNPKRP